MSPVEALDRAIQQVFLFSGPRTPGAYIQRLPSQLRDALKALTSADALNMRPLEDTPLRRSARWRRRD